MEEPRKVDPERAKIDAAIFEALGLLSEAGKLQTEGRMSEPIDESGTAIKLTPEGLQKFQEIQAVISRLTHPT